MSIRQLLPLAIALSLVPIGCQTSEPGAGHGEPETILAEATIGPAGGTIATPQGATVTVSEGALLEPTTVSVSSVPTSQLPALPSAIMPEPTAFAIDFGGRESEKPIEVTLSIPGTEELSTTNTYPCVLSHDRTSGLWSVPVQVAIEDGLVVVESSESAEFVTCSISEASSAGAKVGSASREIPFLFGQDTFAISNSEGLLIRHPRGACWGFAHFAAWHYEHYRCERLYSKYDRNTQVDIVEDAQDELEGLSPAGLSGWLASVQQLVAAIGADVADATTPILPDVLSLTQDLLTIGTIKAHLEVLETPVVISLLTHDGLGRLLAAMLADRIAEPSLNYVAEIVGGGNIEYIDIENVGGHAAVVFSCQNGTMLIYDPNRPSEAGRISYTPLTGILPYERAGLRFENVVYELRLDSQAMGRIHDSYQHLATIPEGACDEVDVEPSDEEPSSQLFANAGPDQNIVDEDCDGQVLVTLNAAGSSDTGGAPISYAWTEGGATLGTESYVENIPLSLGEHEITLTVTRSTDGAEAEDALVVTVKQPNECEDQGGQNGVAAIAAGARHGLLIKNDGTVWAWGSNSKGQLGDGTNTNSSVPVRIMDLTDVSAISAGASHSLALRNDGTVWAWGSNSKGQLGDGTNIDRNAPVQVLDLPDVQAIAAGSSDYGGSSMALKNDGTVWAWGNNFHGNLGDGTTWARNLPVQVVNLTGVSAIAAGDSHNFALTSDGTVYAWGHGSWGELGDGTNTESRVRVPVEVLNLRGISALAAGRMYSLGLKDDGTVWAWGYNSLGNLGDGTRTHSSVPVPVLDLTDVAAIAAGQLQSLALKNDGTVWEWGYNIHGELGDGTGGVELSMTVITVPVRVLDLTDVAAIASGEDQGLALKNDGTVWAWGWNFHGELGDSTNTTSNIAVQVISD